MNSLSERMGAVSVDTRLNNSKASFLFMGTKELEIFRDIPILGYENSYQISTFGRVKSLKGLKERILKLALNDGGYLTVGLSKSGKIKTFKVHILVAMAFFNHKPDGTQKIVVDHIDHNRQNNHTSNIQLLSQRENANQKHFKHSSIYTGVFWYKKIKKWRSQIVINGRKKYLGYFTDEYEAHLAYETALNNHLKQ